MSVKPDVSAIPSLWLEKIRQGFKPTLTMSWEGGTALIARTGGCEGRIETFTTLNEFYFKFAGHKLDLDVYCNGHRVRSEVESSQNALLLPSRTAVSLHINSHMNCDILAIKVTDAFLDSCSATDRASFRPVLNPADEIDWQIARLIYEECRRGGPNGELFAKSAAIMLGISLMRRQSSAQEGRGALARGGLSLASLRRACNFMEERLEVGVSLAEIAAVIGLSVGHFASCFKRSTGLSPYAWLRQKRIERAKQLLGNADLQLGEIAVRSGFSNQSAFGVAFRRETGLTPSQWRRQALE